MKMQSILSAVVCILGFSSMAKADTCICEIDTVIRSEMKYYRMGCNEWLNRLIRQDKCEWWDVREKASDYSPLDLPKHASKKVILGYVGHWSSSEQTKFYIDRVLLPTMKATGVSIEYDNTACSATSDTEDLQKYFAKEVRPQLKQNQYLAIKGNQVISIGLWDSFFGPTANMYSFVDSRRKKAVYPQCKDFENKACVGPDTMLGKLLGAQQVQVGTSGYCKNTRNELVQLTCTQISKRKYSWLAE